MNFNIDNDNKTVTAILTNGSFRTFKTTFPKKIDVHGFRSMNVCETLSVKIISGDYSSCVYDTYLELGFTISNTKKEIHYKLQLEEVFTQINLDLIDLNLIPDNLKQHFVSLQNQINYFRSKMEALIEENESLKHHDYDYDSYN